MNTRWLKLSLMAGASLWLAGSRAPAQGKEPLGVVAIRPAPTLQRAMTSANKGASLDRVVESFDGQLIDRLNATRKFDIVARSDLKDLLKEQELTGSGNVDALDKKAAQAGKLAGAKYILVVTLDDFEDSTERMEFPTRHTVGLKRKIRVSALAKIYDSTTGKLFESANIQALKKDDREDPIDLAKNSDLTDAVFVDATREVAEKIANKVADAAFPARVLAKRDNEVTLNRGEGAGVALGEVWNAFAIGDELIDPDTKESLGREEVRVGKVKISQINPKTSRAEILEDTGIAVGAVLRKPPQ